MNVALVSMLTNKLPMAATRYIGRKKLILKKNSPHILFAGGLIGSVASTVLACRATLKLEYALEEIKDDLNTLNDLKTAIDNGENTGDYPVDQFGRDALYVYVKAGLKLGTLYGPAIVVGGLSLAALTGSHVQLTRRNTALIAAYATLQKAYDEYRQRVREQLGEEKELDIYRGGIAAPDRSDLMLDPETGAPYGRFFDEGSEFWKKSAELNQLFLTCQQNCANVMLWARGHLFLNDVYRMLGFEETDAGQVIGWVVGGQGDDYVDFGFMNNSNPDFMNGWEPRVRLTFNVNGVIYGCLGDG